MFLLLGHHIEEMTLSLTELKPFCCVIKILGCKIKRLKAFR